MTTPVGPSMMLSVTWPDVDAVVTARCGLAPLSATHAEAMVSVLAEPGLYEFTGGEPPRLDQLRRRYRAQSVGHSADGQQWWCNWIVTMLDSARPVGYVQATVERSSGELEANIAWVIQPADQGRGVATEAAAGMMAWLAGHGVRHYAAYIHPEHAASSRVASKLGMRPTTVTHDGEVRWESEDRLAARHAEHRP